MGKGRRLVLCAAATMCVAAPASAAADPLEIGHIPQCTQAVPAAISIDTTPVNLEVRVLLDGISLERGQAIFDRANAAYGPLGLRLAPAFEAASLASDGNPADGEDAQGLIDQAKSRFGGQRPAGSDVVYVLTGKDIAALGQTAVAGLADCIGGVAFADRAFAVGEDIDPRIPSFEIGLRFLSDLSAKTAAHEIGHLFGGHHHYANCVEGTPSAAEGEFAPCTLMFNDLEFQALRFGALESLAVAGHAQCYADVVRRCSGAIKRRLHRPARAHRPRHRRR
jgi:hypothetical protein